MRDGGLVAKYEVHNLSVTLEPTQLHYSRVCVRVNPINTTFPHSPAGAALRRPALPSGAAPRREDGGGAATRSVLHLSGLAQCAELCWQLRGLAGGRQVPGAKVALQHNLGLGGAAVVTLYGMGFPPARR